MLYSIIFELFYYSIVHYISKNVNKVPSDLRICEQVPIILHTINIQY